ncbi:MAG: uroporphyrinogen decarboxylase [Oscillospiraceae bacterium]|nr:uroporphyrinogen decarboxylase [Oscillospiraceae bacterium]
MKKERVISAIAHKNTEPVPHSIDLTVPLEARLCDHLKIKHEDVWEWFDNHIEEAKYRKGQWLPGEIYQDPFGVKWDRSGADKDIGTIMEYTLKEPEIGSYRFPEPDLDFVDELSIQMTQNGRDAFKFGKIGFSLFERAWSLRGLENFLADLAGEEKFVCELFEHILEYNLKIIDRALTYPIDGFFVGDDYGQQRGLLMSPETWRRLIKPNLAKMFDRAKSAGRAVALHSCGDLSAILGDLIDIGLDVYQTVQPEIYGLKKIKEEFGAHLTFWGGISTQKVLPYASPDEIKKIARETIEILGKGGGYIAAPTHQVPHDVPVENIIALSEAFKNQV